MTGAGAPGPGAGRGRSRVHPPSDSPADARPDEASIYLAGAVLVVAAQLRDLGAPGAREVRSLEEDLRDWVAFIRREIARAALGDG